MTETPEAIAEQLMTKWLEAGNNSDAAAVAQLFTEHATCVTRIGVLEGRDVIESGHVRTFSRIKLTGRDFKVLKASRLGPNAISVVWAGTTNVSTGAMAGDQGSVYSGVLTSEEGEWRLGLLQCTSVAELT